MIYEVGNHHQCDFCSKSISTNSSLIKHLRTYTVERPYQCNYCKKSFSRSNNLKSHKATHTSDKPYQCRHCDKKISRLDNLKSTHRYTWEKSHINAVCVVRNFQEVTNQKIT